MYKAFVADDEYLVIEGLKLMIDWNKYGFEIAGQASGGREALEKCADLKPELIVTDICMPELSGIDFIKGLRESGYDGEIIILTGYGKIEFARAAMKYGVKYFSEKPIDKDEIEGFLSEIKAELDKKRALDAVTDMPEFTRAVEHSSLIRGKRRESQAEKGETWGIMTVVGAVTAGGIPDTPSWARLYEYTSTMLSYIIAGEGDFDELSEQMYEILRKAFPDAVLFRTRSESESPEECFARTVRYMNTFVHRENGKMYDVIAVPPQKLQVSEIAAYADAVIDLIDVYDENGLRKTIDDFFERLAADTRPKNSAMVFYHYLVININKLIIKSGGDPYIINHRHINTLCFEVSRLYDILIDISCRAIEYINDIRRGNDREMFSRVAEYLQEHYKERILIKEIAKQFYTSPGYLGSVFTKQMGFGIKEYLRQIRMAEAIRLMLETDTNISDISYEVGYKNYNNFYICFEKMFGMSPTQYREIYRHDG